MLTTASGRTTFVNTLCGQKVLHSKDDDDISNAHIEEGVKIKPTTVGTLSDLLIQVITGHGQLMCNRTRDGRGGDAHFLDDLRYTWIRRPD